MSNLKHRPLVLLILDGWGHSEEQHGNAVAQAAKPNFDRLWQNYPHTLLTASGLDVGLPRGQMGNSEVGHLHIGSGRQVLQELAKLDVAIEGGEFFNNPVLTEALRKVMTTDGSLHILGLLSDGGVHSRSVHMEAMVEFAARQGLKKVYVHAFLDGRDTPPKSARQPLDSMLRKMQSLYCGKIASIGGRYYAMDRDKHWDRVAVAYDLLTSGKTDHHFGDVLAALDAAYERGETDEFVKPTAIHSEGEEVVTIKDNDVVVFMNFRADRAREISYALTDQQFSGFERMAVPRLADYVTMTEYAADIAASVAYPNDKLSSMLGEIIAHHGLSQLRIAETEKYAHVTYFINGGREAPFEREDRILVASPRVATYDLQPEMSASEVTNKLLAALESRKYDLVICNYANPDMVGHTGDFNAALRAVECIDLCLGHVVKAVQEVNGELIIIADHGNAEKMIDHTTGQPHTSHTLNLVPFIYVGRKAVVQVELGKLTNVAPTILHLMAIEKPTAMVEDSIVQLL